VPDARGKPGIRSEISGAKPRREAAGGCPHDITQPTRSKEMPMKPFERTDHPALTPALRWISNVMCLWSMCAKPACRRARKCNGEPRDCLRCYAPLVPEDARAGAEVMLHGVMHRFKFDDLREDASEEIDALMEWNALIHQRSGEA
jgi:hypothetical protein